MMSPGALLQALEKLKLREVKALGQPDMDALLETLTNLTSLEVTRVSGQRTLPTLSKLSSLQGLHVSGTSQSIRTCH